MSGAWFRLRPSAAIIRDGALLLIEYDQPGVGLHYNLPGGGLNPDETVYDGLRRELLEEACVKIEIGPLLMVWEIPSGFAGQPHHLGMVFRCDLAQGAQPRLPDPRDEFQIGVRWVSLGDLPGIQLFPLVMAHRLIGLLEPAATGDRFVMGYE